MGMVDVSGWYRLSPGTVRTPPPHDASRLVLGAAEQRMAGKMPARRAGPPPNREQDVKLYRGQMWAGHGMLAFALVLAANRSFIPG